MECCDFVTLKLVYVMDTVHWGMTSISLKLVLQCVLIAAGASRSRKSFGLSKHVEKIEDEVWTFSEQVSVC